MRICIRLGEERSLHAPDGILRERAVGPDHLPVLGVRHRVLQERPHELAIAGRSHIAAAEKIERALRQTCRIGHRLLGRRVAHLAGLVGFAHEVHAVFRAHLALAHAHQHRRRHILGRVALGRKIFAVSLGGRQVLGISLLHRERASVAAFDHA